MTAEEIRLHSIKNAKALTQSLESEHDTVSFYCSIYFHSYQMLAEIAAQLADLVAEVREVKQSMLRADEKIFGVKK